MAIVASFVHDPEHLPPDVRDVSAACDALHVREYILFGMAYSAWFGRHAPDDTLEPPFVRYLYTGQAPIWVRHFSRDILRRRSEGSLDRTTFGLPPLAPQPGTAGRLQIVGRVLLGAVWAVMIATLCLGITN
ncbi:MAG: hypothetical protein ACFCUO_02785 [Rhodospirillales bacterium]